MSTRSQKKRVYSWLGKAICSNEQLQISHYRGISVKSEKSDDDIFPGDFVLIEGKDKYQHFVARLVKLYENGAQEKHAVVQWFSCFEEMPLCQQMSLEKETSWEIFLNENAERDIDIIATSIITSITVIPLAMREAVPITTKDDHIFFLRRSWDGKRLKPLPPGLLAELKDSEKMKRNKNFAAEDYQTPSGKISSLEEEDESISQNTRKNTNTTEMKLRHSVSKSSLSKQRHSQRIAHGTETPGAKKKLQLNSPIKSPRIRLTEQELIELLDSDFVEPLEQPTLKRKVSFMGIKGSPSKIPCTVDEEDLFLDIKPLNSKSGRNSTEVKSASQEVKNSSLKAKNISLKEHVTCSDGVAKQDKICKTPQRNKDMKNQAAIPKTFRKNQQSLEEQPVSEARNPLLTPRLRRKCAQVTAIRIAKQLSFLQTRECSSDEDAYLPPLDSSDSSSSDEEDFKTPKSQMKTTSKISKDMAAHTPTKSPCKASEPRTPKTPRNATPRIRSRKKEAKKPANILEEARTRLHVSAVPDTLPCREKEFQDIYNFIESKLIDGTGGCMYISGVPGTGKTATVHEVIRCLEKAAENNQLPSFQFIEINGMKLTDPHQAYVQILKLLTGQKTSAVHAVVLLEKMFCTPKPKRNPIILVVDELDLLWTRKQNVMYNLFDWPTHKHAKLIVLAIANTMDLPERIMLNRVSSRLGLTRMSFQPYTYKQLHQIILSRMGHLKAFEEDAIQFVSRKVAALSGDARRCLDICRRSTEICELPSQKSVCGAVSMAHVMEAIDEMFSSPYISTIRNASLQEQTFLKAIIAEFRRSGLEEATVQQVFQHHVALCRIDGLQTPTVSDIMAISSRLSACRLLLAESSHKYLHMRIRLNISQDDVMYALKEE